MTEACTPNVGDTAGWIRQCSGVQCIQGTRTFVSDNTFDQLFGGPFPGAKSAFGQRLSVTIKKRQFLSVKFNSGDGSSGLMLQPNGTFGYVALVSVSVNPGDFWGASVVGGANSSLTMSAKSGTHALAKLKPHTDYYLNIAGMAYPAPHDPLWPDEDQSMYGFTPYLYTT